MALSRGTSNDYNTLLTALDEFMRGDHVATVAVVAGGSGHAVGDIITLTDGTFTKAARFIVTSVGGGGDITGIRIWDSGAYSVDPDLTATTNWTTDGSGISSTFDLSMEVSNWIKNLDDATLDGSTERMVWWEETTNDVHIGVRTYTHIDGADTAKNWLCFGASSYNGGLNWYEQPDISPNAVSFTTGDFDTTPSDSCGVYLKDNDGFPIEYWFMVTNRRVIVMAKLFDGVVTTPRYASCYMGLLNPFGTSSEYPYPLYIGGSMSDPLKAWKASVPAFQMSGLTHAVGSNTVGGPSYFLSNDGLWKEVQNSSYSTSGSTRSELNQFVLLPCGNPNINVQSDVTITTDSIGHMQWEQVINMSGNFADDPNYILMPTPDSGGEKRLLVPVTLILSNTTGTTDIDIAGELDGVFWACAQGASQITPEDTLTDSDVFRAFPNGTYLNIDGYQFLRET